MTLPKCAMCGSEFTYEANNQIVCPDCGHESSIDTLLEPSESKKIIKDAHGQVLNDGDSVTIIKDIKVKGSSTSIKIGQKVKDISLVEEVNGHNIEAKIPGFGAMMLKSEVVKKSN